jgi:hypothetical protein
MDTVQQLEELMDSPETESEGDVQESASGGDVRSEVSGEAAEDSASTSTAPDQASVLAMSGAGHSHPATASASERAFEHADNAKPDNAKKPHGHTSHDGGFTGFGAEFLPYSYTDPKVNHHKMDPKVKKLGVQHTRIFVPWNAVTTGLLGKAGPDTEQEKIDELTKALEHNPNEKQRKQLAALKQQHAKDARNVDSFMKTVALAGKHTTINLTFFGAVDHPDRAKECAHILKYYSDHGYTSLQATLENEPNGGNANAKGNRGDFTRGVKTHNKKLEGEAVQDYVDAYKNLHTELEAIGAREDVKIVGGDMVGQNRQEWFKQLVAHGLNKFVDAYSLHIYWGSSAKHTFAKSLENIRILQHMAAKIAPGKAMQVTEFGRKSGGKVAAPHNTETAFEEGLFALSAVTDGYTGLVKWDAFYGGKPGAERGEPGNFEMVGGPKTGYRTDATYALMRMFTHAVDPGWHAHGTNHGVTGSECSFRSEDGHHGAILAMSRGGKSISTASLPAHHGKLHVHTWRNGGLHTQAVPHGDHIDVPAMGAVAISTKPF